MVIRDTEDQIYMTIRTIANIKYEIILGFSRGASKAKPIYLSGKRNSKCKIGRNPDYEGLCCPHENWSNI